jgi:leukotriene-A4 hydrolase
MQKLYFFIFIILGLTMFSCKTESPFSGLTATDYHSFAEPNKAVVKHMDLNLEVNFDEKIILGTVNYRIKNFGSPQIILDVKGLNIKKVEVDKQKVPFSFTDIDPIKGQGLIIPITDKSSQILVEYSTIYGQSDALLWIEKEQTLGKKYPFLFTQGQAILSRTWFPCQDSPGIRATYKAKIKVPKGMLAVMSANNPTEVSADGVYFFSMLKPVPAYLIALSAGELAFKPLSNRVGVYAEPEILEEAANEFSDTELMVQAAEALYGDYAWGRYDLLVLPPSFPFGGMENPMLTFVTPTIIAGDKSLTSLIAHELAHSWSGNTVTNATWNDFWLNEGFTVYFERRIMEKLYGKPYADMLAELGYQDLIKTIGELANTPKDTHLKLNLKDRDPDEGLTDIAYEKGYFFLRVIESAVGREKFDQFVNQYFEDFAYRSISTEDFLIYLKNELPEFSFEKNKVNEWVYGAGLPVNAIIVNSSNFRNVEKKLSGFLKHNDLSFIEETQKWSSHEWLHFIRKLPFDIQVNQLEILDSTFNFTASRNNEILAIWFEKAIYADYRKVDKALETFLIKVGRRKFLIPLYQALIDTDRVEEAKKIYKEARKGYHAVSTATIDAMLLEE